MSKKALLVTIQFVTTNHYDWERPEMYDKKELLHILADEDLNNCDASSVEMTVATKRDGDLDDERLEKIENRLSNHSRYLQSRFHDQRSQSERIAKMEEVIEKLVETVSIQKAHSIIDREDIKDLLIQLKLRRNGGA